MLKTICLFLAALALPALAATESYVVPGDNWWSRAFPKSPPHWRRTHRYTEFGPLLFELAPKQA